MIHDRSYGIVPFRRQGKAVQLLLVKHHAGHWAFPKGHAEAGESPQQAAQRELREETGLDAFRLLPEPLLERYFFMSDRGKVRKTVTYFVGEVGGEDPGVPQEAEIAELFWGSPAAVRRKLTFRQGRDLLDRALRAMSDG